MANELKVSFTENSFLLRCKIRWTQLRYCIIW